MVMASGMTTLEDTMKATAMTSSTSMRRMISTARSKFQARLVSIHRRERRILEDSRSLIRSRHLRDALVVIRLR